MDFRTPVIIPESTFRIDHSTKMMLLGSCFSENISARLQEYKFLVKTNPFGIVYNPFSVAAVVKRLLSNKGFDETDLVFHDNVYQSFLHHGLFSHPDKNRCLGNISRSFDEAAGFILKTDVFLITFGTAYVYKLKSTGEVVANCHKFPSSAFVRERLTIEEIVKEWSSVINAISAHHPAAKFIFTVSPIRHWKDGAHENQISKSILHLAIDRLQKMYAPTLSYFPAYEILLDELRDYRFFAEDMMHPSSVAIEYIWERFGETFFTRETIRANSEWDQINRSLDHRPLNNQTENYRHFLKQTLQKLILFRQNHPQIDCSREIEELTEKTDK
ncbi:MAG TPA: GSCFA domain-containing protein, partial [Petrimonas sp.]|uniref:GSCFA domain-containing protein n=1 Tax=Petrimonas sp. TaxID=2023866 RepID=UPI00175748DA|nr:GSCFA domain-containing protein [Petrimonas sp.]